MSITRELINSPVRQSVREARARSVQLIAGLSATAPTIKVFDETTNTDITGDSGVVTGSATISVDTFITPLIDLPTAGRIYRVECWFSAGTQQYIRYFRIETEA